MKYIITNELGGYTVKYQAGKYGNSIRFEYLGTCSRLNAMVKIFKRLKTAENWCRKNTLKGNTSIEYINK